MKGFCLKDLFEVSGADSVNVGKFREKLSQDEFAILIVESVCQYFDIAFHSIVYCDNGDVRITRAKRFAYEFLSRNNIPPGKMLEIIHTDFMKPPRNVAENRMHRHNLTIHIEKIKKTFGISDK